MYRVDLKFSIIYGFDIYVMLVFAKGIAIARCSEVRTCITLRNFR